MTDYDLTETYDYDLPEELIADSPTGSRTSARLMTGGAMPRSSIHFKDLPLRAGDLLILNDTRVVPARVITTKPTGGVVELFVTDVVAPQGDGRWTAPTDSLRLACMTRSSKAVAAGATLTAADGTTFDVVQANAGHAVVSVDTGGASALDVLSRTGQTPLPPYIIRRRQAQGQPAVQPTDETRYQTVYAKTPGAVAAPTAGLHFDAPLLDDLRERGVEVAYLTLDVGPGTFRPVGTDRLSEHAMHSETYRVPATVGAAIAAAREQSGRVVAVGTTTVRALESEVRTEAPFSGSARATDLFITPGFDFRVVDAMITNFHLPKSTLLALVYAFGGVEEVKAMYEEAIRLRYNFYSYGDAMFLTRPK